jgi:hypothetical protein
MSWAYLIVAVVVVILAFVLSPKPVQNTPPEFEELDTPVAKEGIPIPVVHGTYTVKSSNVVWYGDIAYEPVYTEGEGK